MTPHWLTSEIDEKSIQLKQYVNNFILSRELEGQSNKLEGDSILQTCEIIDLAIMDLLPNAETGELQDNELKTYAATSFKLIRFTEIEGDAITEAKHRLRISCLGVIGDHGADAARLLKESSWRELPTNSKDWGERSLSTILDVWLRLLRKQGWEDRDAVIEGVARLRSNQKEYEFKYLSSNESKNSNKKSLAWRLVAFYHLAKAAEVMAIFITEGSIDGNYQVKQILESHFDRVLSAVDNAGDAELDCLTRMLSVTAQQLVANSIWTVTRNANSRQAKFVNQLVQRGRGEKAIFDVLPPQRKALTEQGQINSGRRAVVVSLPTSSGKTLIAQFRILQALNQFEDDRGWVAYLAPTRALVNQVTRRLRKDFESFGVMVEQVSPALEIDGFEEGILTESDLDRQFRVIVTTPEKLDLILRQGWEAKVGRPLTLVVVDEAHNIQSKSRGLKLELLLSTINKECRHAQFLLLTPFISNAKEVARWLGEDSSGDISLSLDWQPNDRVIGICYPEKGGALNKRSFSAEIKFKPVHTSRDTICTDKNYLISSSKDLGGETYSKIKGDATKIAVSVTKSLLRRGPVILMHSRPDYVWNAAEKIKEKLSPVEDKTGRLSLVKEFIKYEFGDNHSLISLLNHGIGVHHSGLSDELRLLMEWLFESENITVLAATTTIAQGVNFPISSVVMAAHQYPYGEDMPPEDFWNIAGRAGRVDQGSVGVVALIASKDEKIEQLSKFINNNTGNLNSSLISMVNEVIESFGTIKLQGLVSYRPEWSAFVQYLAHTYRQMKRPELFVAEIEQTLRGTLGFSKLRQENISLANNLLASVIEYGEYLAKPNQPLKLVDSTGFSLESIKRALYDASQTGIDADSWRAQDLFSKNSDSLRKMMGVLLAVPELRENLIDATGGSHPDGNKLASIVSDWVNGVELSTIAERHFMSSSTSSEEALNKCCQKLFGKIAQTTSWGMSALLAMTSSDLTEDEIKKLSNIPSRVYYGVNTDEAISLRLLGVPRKAAQRLSNNIKGLLSTPLSSVRSNLRRAGVKPWETALGKEMGETYFRVWQVMEGRE